MANQYRYKIITIKADFINSSEQSIVDPVINFKVNSSVANNNLV